MSWIAWPKARSGLGTLDSSCLHLGFSALQLELPSFSWSLEPSPKWSLESGETSATFPATSYYSLAFSRSGQLVSQLESMLDQLGQGLLLTSSYPSHQPPSTLHYSQQFYQPYKSAPPTQFYTPSCQSKYLNYTQYMPLKQSYSPSNHKPSDTAYSYTRSARFFSVWSWLYSSN